MGGQKRGEERFGCSYRWRVGWQRGRQGSGSSRGVGWQAARLANVGLYSDGGGAGDRQLGVLQSGAGGRGQALVPAKVPPLKAQRAAGAGRVPGSAARRDAGTATVRHLSNTVCRAAGREGQEGRLTLGSAGVSPWAWAPRSTSRLNSRLKWERMLRGEVWAGNRELHAVAVLEGACGATGADESSE